MNVTLAGTPAATRPSFASMLRAELFKISRQRGIWISAIIIAAVFALFSLEYYFILRALSDRLASASEVLPGTVPYSVMTGLLDSVRGFVGIFATLVTVFAIALEYQQGTIRVLLARGVGRLRLLGTKLLASLIVSLGMLVVLLVLALVMGNFDIAAGLGGQSLGAATQLPDFFWSDTLGYIGTVAISVAATVLFAGMFSVLGRSMAFGLSFALAYFPVESIVGNILRAIGVANNDPTWTNIPNYFFGTALTNMPLEWLPNRNLSIFQLLNRAVQGISGSIDGTQVLTVTVIYVVAFAALTGYLMQKRDVLQ
jgi:ABC-2 type transport system permease protein